MRIKEGETYFYRGKYLIALYDEGDYLVEVADNPRMLLTDAGIEESEKNISRMWNKVSWALKKEDRSMVWLGIRCTLHLIPWEEEDDALQR